MLGRGAQVLTECQDLDSGFGQIGHRLGQLVARFAHATDDARLGEHRRVDRLRVFQHVQGPLVAAARTGEAVKPADRLQIMTEDGRSRPDDRGDCNGVALEVGCKDLDRAAGGGFADRSDRLGEDGGTAVGQVVTVDRCDDRVLETHRLYGIGDA